MPYGFHLIGTIVRGTNDAPTLVDAESIALIGRRSELVEGPPQYGRNPATGERIVLRREITCRGISNGVGLIGYFDFQFCGYTDANDGSAYGIVVVGSAEGFEEAVAQHATEYAGQLNAKFENATASGG